MEWTPGQEGMDNGMEWSLKWMDRNGMEWNGSAKWMERMDCVGDNQLVVSTAPRRARSPPPPASPCVVRASRSMPPTVSRGLRLEYGS